MAIDIVKKSGWFLLCYEQRAWVLTKIEAAELLDKLNEALGKK